MNQKEMNRLLKGVYSKKTTYKFHCIMYLKNGRRRFLGSFDCPIEAYKHYYNEYLELFGEEPFPLSEINNSTLRRLDRNEKLESYNEKSDRPIRKKRKCLKCGRIFASVSNANRICFYCKKVNRQVLYNPHNLEK